MSSTPQWSDECDDRCNQVPPRVQHAISTSRNRLVGQELLSFGGGRRTLRNDRKIKHYRTSPCGKAQPSADDCCVQRTNNEKPSR
jgi:hypothetical protein